MYKNSSKITFITSNRKKLDTASAVFSKYGIELVSATIDFPDLNTDKIEEGMSCTLDAAAKTMDGYLILSKVGYFINSLNGFPGYYTSYVNKTLTPENILTMVNGVEDRGFSVQTCVGLYSIYERKNTFFYSNSRGYIASKSEGEGTTLDKIMVRKGQKRNQGLYTYDEMINYYSSSMNHYHQVAEYIKSKEL